MTYIHTLQAIWLVGTIIVWAQIVILHKRLRHTRELTAALQEHNRIGLDLIEKLQLRDRQQTNPETEDVKSPMNGTYIHDSLSGEKELK